MGQWLRLFVLVTIVLSPTLAEAYEITVGDTVLDIPVPEGFAPLTEEMQPYYRFSEQFVPETNVQFANFLTNADIEIARQAGTPDANRRCYVQTTRELVDRFSTTREFDELKNAIKTENEAMMKKAEEQMPGLFEKINKGLSDSLHIDAGVAMTQMIPLPTHEETDRSMSYSMLLSYTVNDADGKPVPFEGVVTTTFTHVMGKVLFLYVTAEKEGLEWSREQSASWANSVIAANPSDEETARREAAAPPSPWGRILKNGLVGGLVGGLAGAVVWLVKRR